MNHRPMKARPAGSHYEAITSAFGQIEGGVTRAAEALDLSRGYVNAMADADAVGPKKANMTLQQAGLLSSETGATALAQWLAIKAGGTFIPNCDQTCADTIQDAVASYSRESGEAISAAIMSALDAGAKQRAVREIDEAMNKLAALRSHMTASNVTPIKGAA